MKKRLFSALFVALLILQISCTNKQNLSDPVFVAKSFWTAIQKGDATKAATFIHPETRTQLYKMIKQDIKNHNVPLLPEKLEIEIRQDGTSTLAIIKDSDGVSCLLVEKDGRWWVY